MSWPKSRLFALFVRERADVSYTHGVARSPVTREGSSRSSGQEPGPMRADQVHDGDPIELSNGYPIRCMTAGRRHAGAHIEGAKALATDPAVEDNAGIDAGVVWNDGKNLRAPDIVVGGIERKPGWMDRAPPLAVEYADTGQNESSLRDKISELLEAGTRTIWVVRLKGELRVEVHESGKPMLIVGQDETLEAPGILKNPVPVRALVDPAESNRAALRNLLQRLGYDSLEQIQHDSEKRGKRLGKQEGKRLGRREGNVAGRRSALFTLLSARGLDIDAATRKRIEACTDIDVLDRWIARAATAHSVAEAIPAE
ncbi:MAG: Uma2 family endonuclease [Proteobacteria bacterium]|nr:Uma2 family endonuclease [Pseudomonadota bacterium]